MSFLPHLHRVVGAEHLCSADARQAMNLILAGEVSTPLIASFLVALKMKGETAEEVFGFASAMRENSARVWENGHHAEIGTSLLDTCGTGGGGPATINISTIAAFVAAGAGARVAKHGNRSISSKCGSADILEELGVTIDVEPSMAARAIAEVGIGFLFAPKLHPAMRHAQPARLDLKMRTVFNLLGPLTNPAGAQSQLIGASSSESAELIAGALAHFRPKHAFVVHGTDGLDEITTTGPTIVFEVRGGSVTRHWWKPGDFGVAVAKAEDLRGGDKEANRHAVLSVLSGERGPHRDVVLVNAAVALIAAGLASSPLEGMAMAAESIDSGGAMQKLRHLIELTRPA